MSKYTDLAMARRSQIAPNGRPVYNCCQAVVTAFAEDMGWDEEKCMKAATFFRGGMQMGSVCGAVTGALMALGLSGITDPDAAEKLTSAFRENHEGTVNCQDLLRLSAARGEIKKVHCDALIRECIQYVEEALRRRTDE